MPTESWVSALKLKTIDLHRGLNWETFTASTVTLVETVATVRGAIVAALMVSALLSGLWGDGLWAPAGYAAVLTLLSLFDLDWAMNFEKSSVRAVAMQARLAVAGCFGAACGWISLPYLMGLCIRWLSGIA
jgi:hypothetical protein